MLKSIEIPDKYNLFLKRVAEKYNRPVKKQLEHWIYEAIEKEKALKANPQPKEGADFLENILPEGDLPQ
jgi:hypothetical protein